MDDLINIESGYIRTKLFRAESLRMLGFIFATPMGILVLNMITDQNTNYNVLLLVRFFVALLLLVPARMSFKESLYIMNSVDKVEALT